MSFLYGLVFSFLLSFAYGEFIVIEGQLQCCNRPHYDAAKNQTKINCAPIDDGLIELWGRENSTKGEVGDLLVEAMISDVGRFNVRGSLTKNRPVIFYLKVFHFCGLRVDEMEKNCFRTSVKFIPQKFNSNNGTLKLYPWQISSHNEERDFITCSEPNTTPA